MDDEYEIELPDGRVVTVSAPSPEAAAKGATEWARNNPYQSESDRLGTTYARLVGQVLENAPVIGRGAGALPRAFQMQDELTGAAASLTGALTGRDVSGRAAAEESRRQTAQYRQEAPIRSLGEEFVSTLPVGGPAGPIVGGAIAGGVAGVGSGTDVRSRVEQGVLGAAVGGATGGLLKALTPAAARLAGAIRRTPIGSGLERSLRRAGELRGLTGQEAEAFGELAAAFEADGMGPDEIRRAVDAIAGDDRAALVDVIRKGGATEQLLRLAGTETSAARLALTSRNEELASESVQRVQNILRSNVGVGRIRPTQRELEAARREASAPLYEAFRGQRGITASQLNQRGFGNAPAFTRAFEDAIEQAQNQNKPEVARRLTQALIRGTDRGRETLRIDPNAELSPDILDRVKRQLDRQIDRALNGANPDRQLARDLISLRDRYVGFLDESYPDTYRAAREAYAGESANLTALQRGEQIFKEDAEELAEAVQDMSDSEYEAFRLGASKALNDRIGGLQESSAAAPARLLTGDAQERIRLLFRGEEGAADDFLDQLRREAQRRSAIQRATPSRGGMDQEPPTLGGTVFGAVTEGLNLQPGSVLRRIVQDTRQGLAHESRMQRNTAIANIATDISNLPENAQELTFRQIGSQLGREAENQVRDAVRRVATGAGAQVGQREDRLTTERIRRANLYGI